MGTSFFLSLVFSVDFGCSWGRGVGRVTSKEGWTLTVVLLKRGGLAEGV